MNFINQIKGTLSEFIIDKDIKTPKTHKKSKKKIAKQQHIEAQSTIDYNTHNELDHENKNSNRNDIDNDYKYDYEYEYNYENEHYNCDKNCDDNVNTNSTDDENNERDNRLK